jgi:hypothetical protein
MRNNVLSSRWSCSMLVAVILFLAGTIAAQVGNTGTVLGTVTDPSGAVVPGVSVMLRNTENNLTNEIVTDQSGEFRFLTVPAGRYELTAEKRGFTKVLHSVFAVHAAEPARVDVVLKVGAASEQVTITGAPRW